MIMGVKYWFEGIIQVNILVFLTVKKNERNSFSADPQIRSVFFLSKFTLIDCSIQQKFLKMKKCHIGWCFYFILDELKDRVTAQVWNMGSRGPLKG